MKIKIILYQWLETLFEFLGERCEKAREHFAICPDCERNRYTGKPCQS